MKVIHYGSKTFDTDKFKPVKNKNWVKPDGGLWSSPIDSNFGWKDWNEVEEFKDCREDNSFILELRDSCKILKIDSKEDFQEIEYITEEGYLDYEKISKIYDAIWLTEKGENETRFLGIESSADFYGWDCETILILNTYCFEECL